MARIIGYFLFDDKRVFVKIYLPHAKRTLIRKSGEFRTNPVQTLVKWGFE